VQQSQLSLGRDFEGGATSIASAPEGSSRTVQIAIPALRDDAWIRRVKRVASDAPKVVKHGIGLGVEYRSACRKNDNKDRKDLNSPETSALHKNPPGLERVALKPLG
jgi:hypothetical protein